MSGILQQLRDCVDIDPLSPLINGGGLFYNLGTDLFEYRAVDLSSREPGLGNPAASGYALTSTTLGARSWASVPTLLGYTPEQPLTFGSPLSRSVNAVSIPAASGSQNGYLASGDWTAFNAKQAALGYTPVNKSGDTGIGALSMSGLTVGSFSGVLQATAGAISGSAAHSALGSLSADDHAQYALLAGRSGGQTLIGDTASAGNLLLKPTSNATLGYVGVPYAPRGTANYGLFSLGSGPFDGSTSGFFTGSSSGTGMAMNFTSGFVGDFLCAQKAGVSWWSVDYQGNYSAAANPLTFSASGGIKISPRGNANAALLFDHGAPDYGLILTCPTSITINTGSGYPLYVTRRVYSTADFVSANAAKGLILLDSNSHYWRLTVNTDGSLQTADLGTTLPA